MLATAYNKRDEILQKDEAEIATSQGILLPRNDGLKLLQGWKPQRLPYTPSLWLKNNSPSNTSITNEQIVGIYLLLDIQQSVVVRSPEDLLPIRLVPPSCVSLARHLIWKG